MVDVTDLLLEYLRKKLSGARDSVAAQSFETPAPPVAAGGDGAAPSPEEEAMLAQLLAEESPEEEMEE